MIEIKCSPASREGHKAGARTPARPDVRLQVHGLDAVATPLVRSHHDVSFNVGPHDRPRRSVEGAATPVASSATGT